MFTTFTTQKNILILHNVRQVGSFQKSKNPPVSLNYLGKLLWKKATKPSSSAPVGNDPGPFFPRVSRKLLVSFFPHPFSVCPSDRCARGQVGECWAEKCFLNLVITAREQKRKITEGCTPSHVAIAVEKVAGGLNPSV